MPHRAQLQTRTLNARAIVRLPKSCKASDVISVCQSPSGLLCAINKPGHESRSLFLERCKLNAVHLRDVAHAEKCDGFGLVVTLNLDTARFDNVATQSRILRCPAVHQEVRP